MRVFKKISFFLLVSTLILFFSLALRGASRPPKNIMLIGWDGGEFNVVKEGLKRNRLPNLRKLVAKGTLVNIDIITQPDTKAGWVEILTGYAPEVTGVYSNGDYGPVPEGYTIFERLKEHFGRDKFITAAIISKKSHLGISPPLREVVDEKNETAPENKAITRLKVIVENGVKYRLIPAEPYYYTQKNMDVFKNGLDANGNVTTNVLNLLEKYKDKPFFFFVHFGEPDLSGHWYNMSPEKYELALRGDDSYTGRIIAKLKELNLYDSTLIYVVSDHGMTRTPDGSSNHSRHAFLVTNDSKVIRRGYRVDVAATILKRFGLDLNKIQPPLEGQPLTEKYTE